MRSEAPDQERETNKNQLMAPLSQKVFILLLIMYMFVCGYVSMNMGVNRGQRHQIS